MIKLSFIVLFSFVLALENTLLFSVGKSKVYSSDFFQQLSFNEYAVLDSIKKASAWNSFLDNFPSCYGSRKSVCASQIDHPTYPKSAGNFTGRRVGIIFWTIFLLKFWTTYIF